MVLEGFKPVNLTVGLPSISVTGNGVTFNKTAIVKLGYADYVQLFINEQKKQIAVMVCDKFDENATRFLRNREAKYPSVRWNNKDFLKTISKMMGWNLKICSYKIEGEYYSEENAMVFDLNFAEVIN